LYGLLQIILAGYAVSWTGFGEYTLFNGDIVSLPCFSGHN
jgi:hypothetical protein